MNQMDCLDTGAEREMVLQPDNNSEGNSILTDAIHKSSTVQRFSRMSYGARGLLGHAVPLRSTARRNLSPGNPGLL